MKIDDTGSANRRDFVKAGVGVAAMPVLFGGGAHALAARQERPGSSPRREMPGDPADTRQGPAGARTRTNGRSAAGDPRHSYPRPPFPKQQQEWPGLASKMTPRPDHGEETYQGSGRLIGRKALLTGGDSGIGRAAAIAYAREGADVAINYLPVEESDAREVIELIKSAGCKVVALPGDIRSEEFCAQLVKDAVAQLGGLDILVNNAAKQASQKSILDITTEQFDWTFKTNVYAPFWITKAAVPHMQPGSVIINTASIQAYEPSAHLLDYAQTKACMVNFTKSLAKQLIEKGIRVNAVAPGPFWTPLQPSGGQPPDAIETFGAQSEYGRPGQPAELAPVFVLLASTESSFVTGEVFGATGGSAPF